MTQNNIHKIFIPQKIFIFLKTNKNIEIQKFDPPPKKNDPILRMYEYIRVHPPPPPGIEHVVVPDGVCQMGFFR